MSATRDFSRWAREIANDPRYPQWLPRDEETVALYVMLTEALAEAAAPTKQPAADLPLVWIPTDSRRRHFVN